MRGKPAITLGGAARLRWMARLPTLAALAIWLGACGQSGLPRAKTDVAKPAPAWLNAATNPSLADADKDDDVGASHDDTNNHMVLQFGRPADASERRQIEAQIKRYYAIALAGEGTKGCSMIYSTLAEAIPEDYGQPGGPPYMLGVKTCAAGLNALFKHDRAELAVKVPKLKVTHVLIKERQARAVLNFAALPERELSLTREGHVWKMAAMLDNELP